MKRIIITFIIALFVLILNQPEHLKSTSNNPPVFVNLPQTLTIYAGTPFTYEILAYDVDGHSLIYYLREPPAGVLIDSYKGLISWINPLDGTYNITVGVTDTYSPVVLSTLTLIVKIPPHFLNLPAHLYASTRVPFVFNIDTVNDSHTQFKYYLKKGAPPNMEINRLKGIITWEKPIAGNYKITISIEDGISFVESYLFLRVVDPGITLPKITHSTNNIQGINVSIVRIPPKTNLVPRIVLGKNSIKGREDFKSIVNRTKAIVAINGAFFNAYGTPPDPDEPRGTLIKEGKHLHASYKQTTIGFTYDGKCLMDRISFPIKGGVNGSYAWPSQWFVSSLNHTPSTPNSSGIYLYTPEWGTNLGFTYGNNIVVSRGRVVKKVSKSDVSIPHDGYVISMINQPKEESLLTPGTIVGYQVQFRNAYEEEVNWQEVITAVGAGPRLVVDGRVEVGTGEEGFTEEKIKTLSGTRSAIGFTKNGEILLVSASSATINQLAQIMKDLGAYQAMNLDGGASSALYVKDVYLRNPGRTLNNVLVFSLPQVPVNLIFTIDKMNYLLNDFPFTMDSSPIIKDGRTFLPIRYVAEPMGANIAWDNHTKKVTISLEPTVIELWVGKSIARVNGKDTPIDSQNPRVVPIIINGRTLLPLRFISENLGAQVLWNEKERTISVTYPIK